MCYRHLVFLFYCFFNLFLDRENVQTGERGKESESQAGSKLSVKPNEGLDALTPGSRP